MAAITKSSVSLVLMLILTGISFLENLFRDDEHVMFYHSYAYQDGEEWVVPMRLYVYEYRPSVQRLVTSLVRRSWNLTDEETARLNTRIQDFVVDSESRETVLFSFENDPQSEIFALMDENGEVMRTNLNGVVEGEIRLSEERMDEIKAVQNPENGWLRVRAISPGHSGEGFIRPVSPYGTSVISDVDDTVKITEIPAGAGVVVRNTFFKEFTAAPGMAEMYRDLGEDLFFHYVSGSPWQLFRTLSGFLFGDEAGFPKGTFHMKSVTKNFLSLNTWRDLSDLVLNEDVTLDQKVRQITQIFEHFPHRDFILIGDSGEADPEVFNLIRQAFPGQVKEIYIRDVVNARELAPERLEGMHVIPAPTAERGVSQFDPGRE